MIDPITLKYNALDSAVTLACHNALVSEMADSGFQETYALSARVFPALLYMSCRGIAVNKEKLIEERKRVGIMIDETQAKLDEEVGEPLNVASPQACQAYFYGKLGISPYTKTVKDKYGNRKQSITTDDKAMARIARGTSSRKPYKSAKLVQELRGLLKLRGTYLEIEFDADGRLRCSVNPRGTRFGRLSTSQTIFGTGTNMQNLPEGFKSFLVADSGCYFYELDKARAEWVVVAYASGDAAMIEVCRQGLDPHLHTAFQMYGVDKELITMDNKLIGHSTDPMEISEKRQLFTEKGIDTSEWPRVMSMRQAGKKSNHGLNYDEGFRTFALTNEIPEAEAKRMIDLYHSGYPGIRTWHDSVQSLLRHDRTLTNCFGRKYKFLDAWGSDLFKAAYAFLPQSTVADLVNESLALTYADQSDIMEHSELLMQVHDSALMQQHFTESGWDYRLWAASIIRQVEHMNPTMTYSGREFTIDSDLKIGTDWGNMVEVELSTNITELEHKLEEACRELEVLQ